MPQLTANMSQKGQTSFILMSQIREEGNNGIQSYSKESPKRIHIIFRKFSVYAKFYCISKCNHLQSDEY